MKTEVEIWSIGRDGNELFDLKYFDLYTDAVDFTNDFNRKESLQLETNFDRQFIMEAKLKTHLRSVK